MSKNKKILESNESYVKRPGLITQVYYPESLSNSTINMMSPYGGTIYVDRSADASFDMVIDGVIEMPYFIGGIPNTKLEFYTSFSYSVLKDYSLQEKQQMTNSMK